MTTPDPRELTPEDIAAFFRAARRAPRRPSKHQPRDVGELLVHLAQRYPFRMRRIHKDLRWLARRGRRYGIEVM